MATELEQLQEAIETAYAVLDEMLDRLESFVDDDGEALVMTDFVADDSELFHADGKRKYDPRKAHEYYMRTRKLKGRKPTNHQAPTYSKGEKMWLDLTGGNASLIELRRKHDTSANRKRVADVFNRLTRPQQTGGKMAIRVGQKASVVPKAVASRYLTVLSTMFKGLGADQAGATVAKVRDKID